VNIQSSPSITCQTTHTYQHQQGCNTKNSVRELSKLIVPFIRCAQTVTERRRKYTAMKSSEQTDTAGNIVGEAEAATSSSSSSSSSNVPLVLTRSMIPNLAITSLDAGDVLECYHLTRTTLLHGTPIQITKSALGLRYRHRPAAGMKYDRRRLELTIEYGPARAGSTLAHESIPHIIVDEELGDDTNDNAALRNTASVTWDNEGKVYYTEYIDSDTYSSANYLASLSGTLLSKLLNSAVDFVESTSTRNQRRRRYQPFSVYVVSSAPPSQQLTDSTNTTQQPPKQILKSSSDVDFLQYLFSALAELGVELKPVILPAVTEVRLHVTDMVKVQTGNSVLPVNFYQKLYACVKAIGSTDYSTYNISKSIATSVPTTNPSSSPSIPPTMASMIVRPPTYAKQQPVVTETPTPSGQNPPTIRHRNQYHRSLLDDDFSNSNATLSPTIFPTVSPQEGTNNMDMATHQEQAANAAQQAQEAADAAGAADTEDKAVSAAQQAAVYAQKAATVTANQAAIMARDAIVSGVGSSVAQAVSLCFSDSMYGIALPSPMNRGINMTNGAIVENISDTTTFPSTTTVYLYWDGTFYYRMNLTAPYVTVVSRVRPMPKPPVLGIGREDFVDWTIAFFVVLCTAMGFILLLQQVMGRNLKVIRPLYRFQRWFFQPTQFDWSQMMEESEATRAIGQEYSFGEDAIPLSMGGRKYGNNAAAALKAGSNFTESRADSWLRVSDDHIIDESENLMLGDMELVNRSQHWTPSVKNGSIGLIQQYEKSASFQSDVSDDVGDVDGSIVRMFRDPNLVDLPDLTSNSKVAIPVSLSLSNHNNAIDS
jgi:hypothetical protein